MKTEISIACEGLVGLSEHEIVSITLLGDDFKRLPLFLAHHRRIGVSKFIFVAMNSKDGSVSYLRTQEDCLLIETTLSYRDHKAQIRSAVADEFAENRWVVFLDVDELLVYPNFESDSLNEFLANMDEGGFTAVQANMIDTFELNPQKSVSVAEKIEQKGWMFQRGGHFFRPSPSETLRGWPTPRFEFLGGPRFWIFHVADQLSRMKRADLLVRSTLTSPQTVRFLPRGLAPWFIRFCWKGFPPVGELTSLKLSKLALLKWKRGTKFSGGVHRVDTNYLVADVFVGLIHTVLIDDFHEKVSRSIMERQHDQGSQEYFLYLRRLGQIDLHKELAGLKRREFSSSRNLIMEGLIGRGPATSFKK